MSGPDATDPGFHQGRDLLAGWAIRSKRPGSYQDYTTLAASADPFTEGQLNFLLSRHPGDAPATHEQSPAALPWVWSGPAKVTATGIWYLCVTTRAWTNNADATNRAIAEDRFFCLDLDEFGRSRCGLRDIYQVLLEIDLPIDAANPLRSDHVRVHLSGDAALEPVTDLHMHVAAALFDGPVTLLGGPANLDSRLAFLDTVAGLLPAGARQWLSVGGWASSTTHTLDLSFARRSRQTDAIVDLRTNNYGGRKLESAARTYYAALGNMIDRHGHDAVIAYLASLTSVTARDAEAARQGLVDLDLPHVLAEAARKQTLSFAELQRVGIDRLASLPRAQLQEIVPQILRVAPLWYLSEQRALLAAHLLDDAKDTVVTAALRTLHAPTDTPDRTLRALADLTAALRARAQFAEALRQAYQPGGTGLPIEATGRILAELAADRDWRRALAPAVAGCRSLTSAVAKSSFDRFDSAWIKLLDQVDPPVGYWASVSPVVWKLHHNSYGPLQPSEIARLWAVDSDLVRGLLELTQRGDSRRAADIWAASLPVLEEHAGTLPESLLTLLQDMRSADRHLQFSLDYLVYRQRPNWISTLGVEDSDLSVLAELAGRAAMPREFVDFLARRLRGGWLSVSAAQAHPNGPRLSDSSTRLLDALWTLSHPAGAESVVTPQLTKAIASEIKNDRRLLESPELARWLPDLTLDPTLNRRTVTTAAAISAAAPSPQRSVAEMAEAIVERWKSGDSEERTLTSWLAKTKWRRSAHVWMDLAERISLGLNGTHDPTLPARILITRLANGELDLVAEKQARSMLATVGMNRLIYNLWMQDAIFDTNPASFDGDAAGRLRAIAEQAARAVKLVKDRSPRSSGDRGARTQTTAAPRAISAHPHDTAPTPQLRSDSSVDEVAQIAVRRVLAGFDLMNFVDWFAYSRWRQPAEVWMDLAVRISDELDQIGIDKSYLLGRTLVHELTRGRLDLVTEAEAGPALARASIAQLERGFQLQSAIIFIKPATYVDRLDSFGRGVSELAKDVERQTRGGRILGLGWLWGSKHGEPDEP